MAKEVRLNVRIDQNGNTHVTPEGTVGPECLELMSFLDHIAGLQNVEVVDLDSDDSKVRIKGTQTVG
jgi:hypothetical protein